jgi:hypothetical protein
MNKSTFKTVGMIATFHFAVVSYGLYSPLLAAGHVLNISAGDKHGIYHLALAVIVDAPFADVHHVVTDYVHIYRIDPSIVESEILGKPDASSTRVKTLVNDCVFFFCQNILRVEDVQPVLRSNCIECHSPPNGEGYLKTGLSMATYGDLMHGTIYGSVIVPGNSRHSILNMLVEGRADPSMRMPHGRKTLGANEVEILRLWVEQGALNN